MGFCALCQCLNQGVTPARSTFPAPSPLPALNPSTCVPCTDIQMGADNTRDLHVSVIAWICHTSQPGGLPPQPGEPGAGDGEGSASARPGRGGMGLGRLTGEGRTAAHTGRENKQWAILWPFGQALGSGGGVRVRVRASAHPPEPWGTLAPLPLGSAPLQPGGSTPMHLRARGGLGNAGN